MSNQTGARYLARKNKAEKGEVCVQHYSTNQISIPVKDGVRKRPRILKRQAE